MVQFFDSDVDQNAHEVGVLRSSFIHVNPLLLMADLNVNCGPISPNGPYGEGLAFSSIPASFVLVVDAFFDKTVRLM